jgi:hypothetical protein
MGNEKYEKTEYSSSSSSTAAAINRGGFGNNQKQQKSPAKSNINIYKYNEAADN